VGYQNFAGTTTTNQQAQVRITYKVKWFKPIATAEQNLDCDYFGNERITPEVLSKLAKIPGRVAALDVDRKRAEVKAFKSIDIPTAETKRELPLKKAAAHVGAGIGLKIERDDVDDDDEKDFLEYLRTKKARSAVRQALAFEDSDFSGTRSLQSGIQ